MSFPFKDVACYSQPVSQPTRQFCLPACVPVRLPATPPAKQPVGNEAVSQPGWPVTEPAWEPASVGGPNFMCMYIYIYIYFYYYNNDNSNKYIYIYILRESLAGSRLGGQQAGKRGV